MSVCLSMSILHLCVYLVVFSVCGSSADRFPVLPPPTLPSSLFPRSDLEEEKQRDVYIKHIVSCFMRKR